MSQVADRSSVVIMNTYGSRPRTFVRGDGIVLFDDAGKSYLDCLGGLAVVAVGHANPAVTRAVADQVAVLAQIGRAHV